MKKISINKTYKKAKNPVVRRLRITQDKPVQISKFHLKRIIDDVKKPNTKTSKHKMIKEYGNKASVALTECILPSLDFLSNYSPSYMFSSSLSTLLFQLRKSLLKHDWHSCAKMIQILINSKQINKRLLMYVIRSSLILLFNHDDGPYVLEEFLSISLGINDDTKVNSFLHSIFVLPERMKLGAVLEAHRKLKKRDWI